MNVTVGSGRCSPPDAGAVLSFPVATSTFRCPLFPGMAPTVAEWNKRVKMGG